MSAIGLGQRTQTLGSLRTGIAWSTAKVPVAMAVVHAGSNDAQRGDLRAAITASDNAAALRLWSALGGGRVAGDAADEQLHAGGDPRTHIQSRTLRAGYTPFGQTEWTLADQVRFTAGMRCVRAGTQVLALMGQVIPAHRWGLGAPGVNAQFKGGWGPGSRPGIAAGNLDRQMGIATINGTPLAIAIATIPTDGSHQTGARNLTTLARWIVHHADVRDLPTRPTC